MAFLLIAYANEFGYDLSRTRDEIRLDYRHIQICQQTVLGTITAFLESESCEDVVRTVIPLGGDCDTAAAIAGSTAEKSYGIPEKLNGICRSKLPADFRRVLEIFIKQNQ